MFSSNVCSRWLRHTGAGNKNSAPRRDQHRWDSCIWATHRLLSRRSNGGSLPSRTGGHSRSMISPGEGQYYPRSPHMPILAGRVICGFHRDSFKKLVGWAFPMRSCLKMISRRATISPGRMSGHSNICSSVCHKSSRSSSEKPVCVARCGEINHGHGISRRAP
jgi:hypothetical protein